MSLANYVIGKGVKTLETSLEEEPNVQTKMAIITEELLYRQLMQNHRCFMLLLFLFHILLSILVVLRVLTTSSVEEEKKMCQHSLSLRNLVFLLANGPLLIFSLQGLVKNQEILMSISFYEKTQSLLCLGMLSSFLVLFYKFVPDYVCLHNRVSMEESGMMFLQVFSESSILFLYVNWFKRRLRKFGALIN